MIFVKANNQASATLRADQIADKLGARVFLNDLPENVSGETVVFVKEADPDLVIKASTDGARIIYDPIDQFAYKERLGWKHWYYFVDTVICYSEEMEKLALGWFKKTVIIPHQWDARLTDTAPVDRFRPGYIGRTFNCQHAILGSGIGVISEPSDMLQWASSFNCHVSIREPDSLEAKCKPATKVATAAAVGAVIITSKDSATRALLPDSYPYWCESVSAFPDVLDKAKAEFNGPEWNKALEMMDDVKDKTSLETVARKYNDLHTPQIHGEVRALADSARG